MLEISILRDHYEVAKKNFPTLPASFEEFVEQSINRYIPEIEPTPVLVGHLNKRFGWNGAKFAEIGTEVFEHKGMYQFTVYSEQNGSPIVRTFYKDTLKPCINYV
jgi:hypothetical protein